MARERPELHPRPRRYQGTYSYGADDLAFGELLPDKPGWFDQEEYEERTKVGFQLERLTKTEQK